MWCGAFFKEIAVLCGAVCELQCGKVQCVGNYNVVNYRMVRCSLRQSKCGGVHFGGVEQCGAVLFVIKESVVWCSLL